MGMQQIKVSGSQTTCSPFRAELGHKYNHHWLEKGTWWSEREKFQDSVVAKGFFAQPAKTGTSTWEQLAAMFSPLNEL